MFIIDFESRILSVKSVVLRRLKYSKDELFGNSALMASPSEMREETTIILQEMVLDPLIICPIPLQTKERKTILVESKITKGKWGNRAILFRINRNNTERKRENKELVIKLH
ncbi:MAG: hypothetical protein ACFFG0_40375 [Candidatus Thorarchaeota archaeon]